MKSMCRVLDVSRSGYYAWRVRRPSKRATESLKLVDVIRQVHQESHKTYGSPRVTAELRNMGYRCGENRVAKLMRYHGLRAKMKRRYKGIFYVHAMYEASGNKLQKGVYTDGPNQIWAADMTYLKTPQGWLYLVAIMDLHSRSIVGWSMDHRRDQNMVVRALDHAILRRRPPKGLILHTDQGVEFTCYPFQNRMKEHGIIASMSRKGHVYDNAFMESFFHTLKTELVYCQTFSSRDEMRQKVFEYIEGFYNRKRIHSGLGFQSPLDFEMNKNKLN